MVEKEVRFLLISLKTFKNFYMKNYLIIAIMLFSLNSYGQHFIGLKIDHNSYPMLHDREIDTFGRIKSEVGFGITYSIVNKKTNFTFGSSYFTVTNAININMSISVKLNRRKKKKKKH